MMNKCYLLPEIQNLQLIELYSLQQLLSMCRFLCVDVAEKTVSDGTVFLNVWRAPIFWAQTEWKLGIQVLISAEVLCDNESLSSVVVKQIRRQNKIYL